MKCPRCGGSGICIECQGTGSVPCNMCSATGTIPIVLTSGKSRSAPCSQCHGKKTVDCSRECVSCGGRGEITSEFQKEIREKYQPSFTIIREYRAYVSLAILIINFVVFVTDSLFYLMTGKSMLLLLGEFYVPLLLAGQWWRMVTSLFLHIGILHFLLNSYCLFILCPPIEKEAGPLKFAGLYLFSGIMGNLLSMLIIPTVPSAGASGALFGIMGAYFGLNFRYRIFHPSLMQQLFYLLIINLAVGFWASSSINIWAHLGGLAGGFVFSYLVKLK